MKPLYMIEPDINLPILRLPRKDHVKFAKAQLRKLLEKKENSKN